MTIREKIVNAGIPKTHHDSARRAIQRILIESDGRIPKKDIIAIIKILAEAL
jgi:hypothetical protein